MSMLSHFQEFIYGMGSILEPFGSSGRYDVPNGTERQRDVEKIRGDFTAVESSMDERLRELGERDGKSHAGVSKRQGHPRYGVKDRNRLADIAHCSD